ncbi:MAG: GPR endopeptidase [Bacilli bacterium]
MKQKLIYDAAKSIMDKKGKISINESNKKDYKRSEGDYYIIKYDDITLIKKRKLLIKKIENAIDNLLKKNGTNKNAKILVIGLGNKSIIADSLGPITADKLIATNHMEDFITIPKITIFTPNIMYKTGINSFKLIKMLVDDIKPSILIFIDSLSTTAKENLNKMVEINDEGIIAGQNLSTFREINKKTFNLPIISIGVPLVFYDTNISLTLPNINEVIESISDVISESLNKLFLNN